MGEDRAEGIEVRITHETIAAMLGVRRSGVTTALGALEQQNYVQMQRGQISVLNRGAIEKIVGSFYGFPEQEYQRLVSGSWPQNFNHPQA
jgi:hypothetical protein